ncbi:MAG: hypothetical protein WDW38_008880 [Sanguina aurantia]
MASFAWPSPPIDPACTNSHTSPPLVWQPTAHEPAHDSHHLRYAFILGSPSPQPPPLPRLPASPVPQQRLSQGAAPSEIVRPPDLFSRCSSPNLGKRISVKGSRPVPAGRAAKPNDARPHSAGMLTDPTLNQQTPSPGSGIQRRSPPATSKAASTLLAWAAAASNVFITSTVTATGGC